MVDLAITPPGDLIPNWAGGLTINQGIPLDMSDINYRMLTNNPDQQQWPIGANLLDLVGMPNNQQTGYLGETSISQALTVDGRFSSQNVSVDAIPLDLNSIMFTVSVTETTVQSTAPLYTTVVNLTNGS